MGLLRCFYTAVLLQCRVLETRGECPELVMRLDFMVVHPLLCVLPASDCQNTCVCECVCVCLLTQQMVTLIFSMFL